LEVTGEDPESTFYFRWEEFNTSAATRREDSDFGVILLDRVAPRRLAAQSKRLFYRLSYVYELTAPMETVIDMNRAGPDRANCRLCPQQRGRFPSIQRHSGSAHSKSAVADLDMILPNSG